MFKNVRASVLSVSASVILIHSTFRTSGSKKCVHLCMGCKMVQSFENGTLEYFNHGFLIEVVFISG
jgi:hypothetical protein